MVVNPIPLWYETHPSTVPNIHHVFVSGCLDLNGWISPFISHKKNDVKHFLKPCKTHHYLIPFFRHFRNPMISIDIPLKYLMLSGLDFIFFLTNIDIPQISIDIPQNPMFFLTKKALPFAPQKNIARGANGPWRHQVSAWGWTPSHTPRWRLVGSTVEAMEKPSRWMMIPSGELT